MEKTIFEQMGGTYTHQGDCYLPNLVLPTEKETRPIGVWGQRHLRYLKECHRITYANLLTSGKLNSYLVDIDERAENMFLPLVMIIIKIFGMGMLTLILRINRPPNLNLI